VSEPIADARKLLEGLAVRLRQRAKSHHCGASDDLIASAVDIVAEEVEHLLRERIVKTPDGMHECPYCHTLTRDTTLGCDQCDV